MRGSQEFFTPPQGGWNVLAPPKGAGFFYSWSRVGLAGFFTPPQGWGLFFSVSLKYFPLLCSKIPLLVYIFEGFVDLSSGGGLVFFSTDGQGEPGLFNPWSGEGLDI